MKKTIKTLMIIVAALALVACGKGKSEQTTTSSSTDKNEIHLIVKNQGTVIKEENCPIKDGKLYPSIQDKVDIVLEKGFVTEVEGIKQDVEKKLYWMYTINGEWGTVGLTEATVKKGDTIELYLGDQ